MAKSVILDVLEKTIGKYVVNLDTNSLNVALWSGKIELHTLQLDVRTINQELDQMQPPLPFRVQSGYFNQFQVDVPWSKLMSQSVVLRAKGLHIQIVPCHSTTAAPDKDKKKEATTTTTATTTTAQQQVDSTRLLAIQQANDYREQTNALRNLALQDLEERTTSNNKTGQQSSSSSSSFGSKMLRRVIENIQIDISQVHVSLESDESSVGVLLESLRLGTTDESGRRTFVNRTASSSSNEPFLYKKLEIRGLAVYLDDCENSPTRGSRRSTQKTDATALSSIREGTEDEDHAKDDEDDDDDSILDHSYILAPLSFEATLRQADSTGDKCVEHPKYLLQSKLSSLCILLNKTQLEAAHKIGVLLHPPRETPRLTPLFPEYRPRVPLLCTGDANERRKAAQQWWKYALRCLGRLSGRRLWVEFFLAFRKRNNYMALYKRKMYGHSKSSPKKSAKKEKTTACHWILPLTPPEEEQLRQLESDPSISVEGIMAWRNMADAQVQKEQEKYNQQNNKNTATAKKSSLFTSLFGSSSTASSAASGTDTSESEEAPPIALSSQERQELESLALATSLEQDSLSVDSKLYDICFVLGNFHIDLTSYHLTPLSQVQMGTVESRFSACANGSYTFEFGLQSLCIEDKITINSSFPTVLKNQMSGKQEKAFVVQMKRSATGDQHLQVKLSTFELIASPNWLVEMKRFVSVDNFTERVNKLKANPILAQSLSGSVDLFYDANEGSMSGNLAPSGLPNSSELLHKPPPSTALSDNLSLALFDAWKARTETQSLWSIDLDIHAPILVVPESSTNRLASVLVFDFGHLTCNYGTAVTPHLQVKEWFDANPYTPSQEQDPMIDFGSISVGSLSFWIGHVSEWKELVRRNDPSQQLENFGRGSAVIEPISIALHLGVETRSAERVPRICMFTVLPSIVISLSPDRLASILSVYNSWIGLMKDFGGASNLEDLAEKNERNNIGLDNNSVSTGGSRIFERAMNLGMLQQSEDSQHPPPSHRCKQFYANVQLQRLSLKVWMAGKDEKQDGLEANLVSVNTALSSLTDGRTMLKLKMGWFWILDKSHNDFVRSQRFLAHSRLPRASSEYALDPPDSVISELDGMGVFSPLYEGSSDLADISLIYSPNEKTIGTLDPFSADSTTVDDVAANVLADAKLTSLYVNYNPRAMLQIIDGLGQLSSFLGESLGPKRRSDTVIVLEPQNVVNVGPLDTDKDETDKPPVTFVVRAYLESVELCLRSARDDLPIFSLAMSSADVSFVTRSTGDSLLNASLGNLEIATPSLGRTKETYRSLLGLSPGMSDSLLSLSYATGDNSLASLKERTNLGSLPGLSTLAVIDVSPMRMVYIQSQIMALVEYASEGILGSLTQQAASTAVTAAAEMASSGLERKLFVIRTVGFEILVPEAAHSDIFFSMRTGELSAEYTALPNEEGGKANISISELVIVDPRETDMLNCPIHAKLAVKIPPEGVGSNDDQAFRVKIDLGETGFLVRKSQYDLIFSVLDKNFGELNLFLRDEEDSAFAANRELGTGTESKDTTPSNLTHAGVVFVENRRSMYVDVFFHSLAMNLLGENVNDEIVSIQADSTNVSYVQKPAEEEMSVKISLRDLNCTDERAISLGRSDRSLISQDCEDDSKQNMFVFSYKTKGEAKMDADLRIGSPRFVFIPDAINEILAFLKSTRHKEVVITDTASIHESNKVHILEAGDAFEIEAGPLSDKENQKSISVSTGKCSVVLMDIGGETLLQGSERAVPVAETIVLRGSFDCKATIQSRGPNNNLVGAEAQMHGDAVEIYTALGYDSIQVLDPFDFSVYGYARDMDQSSRSVDVRLAVITPIDMCVSMRNYALLTAIANSLSNFFDEEQGPQRALDQALSAQDADHIEHLDHALLEAEKQQNLSANQSFGSDTAITLSDGSSLQDSSDGYELKSSVKITLPDAKLVIVNDLQGLDDALIRFSLRNAVANVQVREGERVQQASEPYVGFDANLNCAILADYFDPSEGLWKDFLMKPWELTLRGARGPNRKLTSLRPSTSVDIESFPCHVSFSEEFLVSLASANRMWSVYQTATSALSQGLPDTQNLNSSSPNDSVAQSAELDTPATRKQRARLRKGMVATAARTFVTALPYAVENNSGFDFDFKVHGSASDLRPCKNGSVEYFRFPPPSSKGVGGKRLYGQDVMFEKIISIRVRGSWIEINNVNAEPDGQRKSHVLENSLVLFSQILREGRTTVLHISSGFDIHGKVSIPIMISIKSNLDFGDPYFEGICGSSLNSGSMSRPSVFQSGTLSKGSSKFGLPADSVRSHRENFKKSGHVSFTICLSPKPPINNDPQNTMDMTGELQINIEHRPDTGGEPRLLMQTETVCKSLGEQGDAFVLKATVIGQIIDQSHPYVDIYLEPRALIENKLPIPVTIRTPMPHIYSTKSSNDTNGSIHNVSPSGRIEIFTAGPSVAISVKLTDHPVGGSPTGWIDGKWVDLPLTPGYRMREPLRCNFPFSSYSGTDYGIPGGVEFFIADGFDALVNLSTLLDSKEEKWQTDVASGLELATQAPDQNGTRTFYISVCNYSVDHTGEMLFGLVDQEAQSRKFSVRRSQATKQQSFESTPLGTYHASDFHGRISLLPASKNGRIQLIHLTMEGDAGMHRSQPFRTEDVSISDGGVNSTAIPWEDGSPSGFFVYQKLVNTFQSELHVIPELVVYNGSKKYEVRVRQPNGVHCAISPGKIAPIRRNAQQQAIISVEWLSFQGKTSPLSVDKLGLRIAVVREPNGVAIGSLAIQTVVGSRDSRLVIKLADIRLGSEARKALMPRTKESMIDGDFLRFRVQWSELKVTLNEARPIVGKKKALLESAFDNIMQQQGVERTSPRQAAKTWLDARNNRTDQDVGIDKSGGDAVCSLILQQFTIDWQRVFKEEQQAGKRRSEKEKLQSLERSQLSAIIHNIRITDETPGSKSPIVLDCSTNTSFFDLCIRVKGPLDAELVKVDLFDLNLAYANKKSERIVLSTSESFAWKLLDLGDRILVAAGEFSGVKLELEWDEEHGGYKVQVREGSSFLDDETRYSPPNSERLFDVALARVSPFILLTSFERDPVKSRYSSGTNNQAAALMNYFTNRLKFKIDRAELKFARYEATGIRGPLDRIIEIIMTVYMSRMKLQIVTLMTAISVHDWKYLAARNGGDDEFMDGDVLRAAGNLAGNTVNYIFKKSGRGIETAFKKGSSSIGDGIETAASKVGVQQFGASVNSVVSGVGGGVGEAVSGVGTGAGKALKGVGRGVGQVVGGVAGGASMMVKGTAKGIASGDGKAVASSVVDGAISVGNGVGQGVSSVVVGTADGVFSVGKGLFSGVQSVSRGVVGAVRMKRSSTKSEKDKAGNN